MNITPRPGYLIVQCTEDDITAFNRSYPAQLPTKEVTFGFERFSGDLKRVIPNAIRTGGTAWEALRDLAWKFTQEEIKR